MKLKLITALGLLVFSICTYAVTTSPLTPQQDNMQRGEAFLNANKTKPGVVTLADGMQYKILKPGTGAKPTANDIVVVEYTGKSINGKEFDSSAKHGGTASFQVNQVIPGWTEILQMMPVGSIWEVYIPANLAYGDQGAPPVINPGETLVFNIKLIDIKK